MPNNTYQYQLDCARSWGLVTADRLQSVNVFFQGTSNRFMTEVMNLRELKRRNHVV